MREQLRKEIVKRTGSCVQSAEGAAVYEEESAKITEHYDRMVADGMTELEAYKALLNDINIMRLKLLAVQAEEAAAAAEKQASETAKTEKKQKNKKLRRLAGGMHAILWLLTPIWYLLSSFFTGDWHMTWLLFLGSAIGSILLDIVVKYNEGMPLHKHGGWHGIFWIGLVMFYFWFSFTFGHWALTWLLFPAGAVVEVFWKILRDGQR